MQCKDIPEQPILEFLAGPYDGWLAPGKGTWFGNEYPNSVTHAMPEGTPSKLALAKMRTMIRRGFVSGCACGCRGDFEITDKGRELLEKIAA
jgi:hypothetical protein